MADALIASADAIVESVGAIDAKLEVNSILKKQTGSAPQKTFFDLKSSYLTGQKRKKHIEAMMYYNQAYDAYKEVYLDTLFGYETEDIYKLTLFNDLVVQAVDKFDKSERLLLELTDWDPDSVIFSTIEESLILKITGTYMLEQAFCVHLGCPVDTTVIEKTAGTLASIGENEDDIDYTEVDEDMILFRVEIATSKTALNEESLKAIYDGYAETFEKFDGAMFSYQVGDFYSYKEASDFALGLANIKTRVLAIQGGKEIDLKHAMRLTGQAE